MNPPRWFWVVLAVCIVAVTAFWCWDVWFENRSRFHRAPSSQAEIDQIERDARAIASDPDAP